MYDVLRVCVVCVCVRKYCAVTQDKWMNSRSNWSSLVFLREAPRGGSMLFCRLSAHACTYTTTPRLTDN